jgi:NadR type nicotinamide-nucleotide adenylyltransferase
MRRGLVVGKFMPLHRGHELLIDYALAECDDVTVVVYDNHPAGSYPAMPAARRAGWVRTLYPALENIVVLPDPWEDETDNEGPAYAERYAGQVAFLGPFDRFYSSERAYGAFAKHLGAEHRVLDEARAMVPVSGTAIRADPYRYRGMLSPLVYSSLIRRVALVGTESSGKSTLARALAQALGTQWVHEFGRELWEAQGLTGTFADLWKIGRNQREREDKAARHADRFLVCDTNAWTTLHWSLRSYGFADQRLHDLVDATVGDYTWVLCRDDFGWIQDGTREMAGGEAHHFQVQQEDDLKRRGIPYVVAAGRVEKRVATVVDALSVQPLAEDEVRGIAGPEVD